MRPNVVLFTAYRHSGKDTLVKSLISGDKKAISRWRSLEDNELWRWLCELPADRFCRVAIADRLKKVVQETFFTGVDLATLEENKDVAISECDGRVFRDVLIDYGNKRRQEDAHVWISPVEQEIQEHVKKGKIVLVTDWRLLNELTYLRQSPSLRIATVRLFRKEVLNSPNEIDHKLDAFKTDIILTTPNTPWRLVFDRFPQCDPN